MLIVIGKVFSILAMVAIGFWLYRSGRLGDQARTDLTNLLLTVTAPCLALYTLYEKELTQETILSTVQVACGAVCYLVIGCIIAWIFARVIKTNPQDRGCYIVLMIALNNGFMGLPITKEIFGANALYLLAIHIVFMNIYFYSGAVLQMTSGKGFSLKEAAKSLMSPVMAGLFIGMFMMILGIKPPEMVDSLIRSLGDVTVPLSMIVVGLQLGQSNLKEILKNRHLILCSVFCMAVIPALTFLITNPLPLYNDVKIVIIFSTVFPSAVIPAVLAEKYGANGKLMAEGVTLTTILSMVSIPVAASLLTALYC